MNNNTKDIQNVFDISSGSSELTCLVESKSKYLTSVEFSKFRDISKKIEVINKLVELEERKLEQERLWREKRSKPLFDGNTKERGFVKSLTKNFDMLAKESQENIIVKNWDNNNTALGIKRNYSLPDVLEGAKLQAYEFDNIDLFDQPKILDFTMNQNLNNVSEGVIKYMKLFTR